MAGYRAFVATDPNNNQYLLTYYHNPDRWRDNMVDINSPIRDINNWSEEIKYLNESNDDLSEEIKNLPSDVGGIYIFYIKGINIPFFEN